MKTTFRVILFSFLLLSILTGCSPSEKSVKVNPEFAAYISDYTHGLVPLDAPLNITLTSSPKQSGTPGSEIKEQLFSFEPSVSGKAFWVDEQTIRFIPQQNWPRDQHIEVRFFLNKLLDLPSEFHIFKYSLQTLPLTFELAQVALRLQDYGYSDTYQLHGQILSSEKISPESTQDLLKVRSGSTTHPVHIFYDETIQGLIFVADSIERKNDTYSLTIEWNGKPIGSTQQGEMKIEVPAKDLFLVSQVLVTDLPEQAVHIWFSDALDPNQNLNGLVKLNQNIEVRLDVVGNEVVVYPKEIVEGEMELLISAGIRSQKGKSLSQDERHGIAFDQMKPQVRFAGKSTILSGNSKGMLTFQAVGLRAVDVNIVKVFQNNMLQFLQWNNLDGRDDLQRVGRIVARQQVVLQPDNTSNLLQWQTFGVDLSQLINKDKGAIYRVYLTFKKSYSMWNCDEPSVFSKEELQITDEELAKWGDGSFYDPTYYYPPNFDWRQRNNPCDDSYYFSERFTGRNVLASDLGLMAMESNLASNEYLFVVNNLVTTAVAEGANVELFDYQQQKIASGTTNNQGMVHLTVGAVKPAVAVAKLGDDYAYLKLDQGAALSYSRFDVGGTQLQNGMKGFVFTERGVYRPGDTLFIGFILKDATNTLPADFPVVLELTNARQQLAAKQIQNKLLDGMCLFRIPTSAEAPTGVWKVKIIVGNAVFEKRIWVETIKPNRLKIKMNGLKNDLTKDEAQSQAQVLVNWLHGAKASNMKLVMERSFIPSELKLKAFPAYTFKDISLEPGGVIKNEYQGTTDGQGAWQTNLHLSDLNVNASMVKVQYAVRVTEPGGDFSSATFSTNYYPFDSFLGLQSPEAAANGFLHTDEEQTFNIVNVNRKGEFKGDGTVKVELFKVDWHWWWSGDGMGDAEYVRTYGHEKILEKEVALQAGKATFKWTPKHFQWGVYLVKVSQPEGGHSVSKLVYVDWPDSYSRSGRDLRGGANLLTMSVDKEKYHTGDQAVISFVGPGKGRALISIEKGMQQLKAYWMETVEGENKITLPLTALHSPNIYVHITLLQPITQVKNDLPVRTYGWASLEVEDKNSRLIPVLRLDKEVRTGSNLKIEVNEKNNHAMTYMLAVVDEGLLDLTNHATPDAHQYFYAKEALGLKTWDMYDFILGAYGGKIEQLFTIGGDAALPDREKARQSRFVPVVKVMGPFNLKAGETKSHSMSFENYIGSVRVMAVAVSGNAFGSTEEVLKVKQPLMVLSTLPRLLRQKDEVVMPVTIFSSLKGIHNVKVNLQTSGMVKVEGETETTITFQGADEQTIYFKLKASALSGSGKVEIKAVSDQEKATEKIELTVENPNDRVFEIKTAVVEKGEQYTEKLQFPGDPSTFIGSVEVSSLPAVNMKGRLEELLLFPHGCTEQITSKALAQLYLPKVMNMSSADLETNQQNIHAAVGHLVSRQASDGSIGYWPGTSMVDAWSEIYAGHFMVLAARENKAVPAMFLSQWAKNQRKKAMEWYPKVENNQLLNDHLQAYRLYVLALHGDPQLNAMNRLREHPQLSRAAASTLAAAYALAGQKEAARALALGNTPRPLTNYNYNFGSDMRNKAMLVETLLLLEEKSLAFPLLVEMSKILSSNMWLSTQETAYALYAFQLYAKTFDPKAPASFILTQVQAVHETLEKTVYTTALAAKPENLTIKNTGEQPLYVSISTSGILPVGAFQPKESGISLSVNYYDAKGNAVDVSQLSQGTTFKMEVTVKNQSLRHVNFLALSEVIPAGWEIINNRMNALSFELEQQSNFTDVRDDRVVQYFDLKNGESRRFTTTLIATYAGKFLLPAVHCEAMYDHSINAATAGGWTIIRKSEQ